MKDQITKLCELINTSKRIAFFGGAGVSTESGIPDFRSENGIFKAIREYGYPPEELLSHTFFIMRPDIFFKYYKDLLLCTDAKPNKTHVALARLEQLGKLTSIITQNIDGLHQMAGSRTVFELHGSIHRNFCTKCHRDFDAEYIKNHSGIPYCSCGGIIKPDVVLYEEALDETTVLGAITQIIQSDMLIIGGTSLQVYPAAGFIEYYSGNKMVLINKSPTPLDSNADLVINASIGDVMHDVMQHINC